ncbi:hypothetical protein [Nodularia sphaerocarpa]|uniref:hypothetical protein n=1 Tax=Nodularia sphaerocarpa TaxID=137816 RepID=UPI00232F653A|nr:hypothetical protein [Nodularia sphaerocarpa]MDB9372345.1 hypothetical protein [Nodularia sphaerocarpa CS-585]MDB9377961.1 hypothetical protein [Nodularia sphaerocarpa CS-585A2]
MTQIETRDEDQSYCTRSSDGVSGMSVTALAQFCGVDKSTITKLLNQISDSDPLANELKNALKPFMGKELRSLPIDCYGTVLVSFDVCFAILEYFACSARKYKGRNIVRMRFAQIKSLLSHNLTLTESFEKSIEDTKNLKVRPDSKKRKSYKSIERKIQIRFQKEPQAKINVSVPVGYIDVLTSTEIIEIKQASDWKHAVGQVVCYAVYYPSHQKRLHLFGDADQQFQQLVEESCFTLGIRVTWEDNTITNEILKQPQIVC